jgi:hypothetical protein
VNGATALLKAYFQHPDDPRDRLGAEYSFAWFAWERGVRCLPRPLACDRANRLGLYEFVEGRQLGPAEVTQGMVQQALDFYKAINRHRWRPSAEVLPLASEACFTVAEHLQCVERRLQKLHAIDDSSAINREAARFVRNELSNAWRDVADGVGRRAHELGPDRDAEIPRQDRCLSPSDFGFHNAILASDGRLRFIDFEYAGWDDPAKLVCDFFCQPAVPVSRDYFDMFAEKVISDLSVPEKHGQRIALLLPVYQIKWCCIVLNDFLSVGNERRRFASDTAGWEERKAVQLGKARNMLEIFNQEHHG